MSKMFSAGRYWIGDPRYASISGLIWQHHTAYGDGIYEDQNGRRYGVDSGQLCIAAVKNVDVYDRESGRDLSHIVTFKESFDASYENGTFKFGHVEIRTGDDA